MIYSLSLDRLPDIETIYIVERRTIWQVADPFNILIVIIDGECVIQTNDKKYEMKKGNTIFIPANQTYKRTPVNDTLCKMLYVHFSVKNPISELTDDEAANEYRSIQNEVESNLVIAKRLSRNTADKLKKIYIRTKNSAFSKEILNISDELDRIIKKYSVYNSVYINLYVCQLLAFMSRDTIDYIRKNDTISTEVSLPSTLRKAIWYIKQNYSSQISLDTLCKYCNISKSQLIRYFKKHTGQTPTQYIIEFKINRAREMFLSDPELQVKDVCAKLGFKDQHYFSRVFSKSLKETPIQYKERVVNFKQS